MINWTTIWFDRNDKEKNPREKGADWSQQQYKEVYREHKHLICRVSFYAEFKNSTCYLIDLQSFIR